jgi:gamma-glutamyltranspeptidase / glutathione hydrolase
MRIHLSIAVFLLLLVVPTFEPQNAVGDKPNPRGGGTRSVVRAMNGIIATSHPLASSTGLRILERGGNAVDAAVAAAAVLCVVEPMMVSPGGDLFALVWDAKKKELKALNSSGRSPRGLSIDALRKQGIDRTPGAGIHAVTIPGAVEGWSQLLKRN